MKWSVLSFVLLVGCAANKPVQVAVNPTSAFAPTATPKLKPTTSPKPKSTPVIEPDDVFHARSLDGRFEATGTLFRVPDIHGFVEVRDANTKRVVVSWRAPEGVTGLSFSPDGKTLVVNGSGQLKVWNWRAKKVVFAQSFDQEGSWVRITSDFSRDGQWLVANDCDGSIWLFETRSWKKRNFDSFVAQRVVFSPNSRFVVAWGGDTPTAYTLVFVDSGKVQEIPPNSSPMRVSYPSGVPMFSCDGRLMVLVMGKEEGGEVQLWDVARARLKRKLVAPTNSEESFYADALSPDARFLVGENYDGEKNRVVVQRLFDGKTVLSLLQDPDSIRWLDSRTLELKEGKTTKRILVPGAKR